MTRGRFVTIEGIDGSGKSTQMALLADTLRAQGRTVVVTREPGGTVLGEQLREIVLMGDGPIEPAAEALIFAAARAQLVRTEIAPALEAGSWVLADRFLDSSLAYQGAARGLGIDVVRRANALSVEGCLPDLTIVLDVPVAMALARETGPDDRIEAEGARLQQAVADGYREIAQAEPERVILVPADDSPEAVGKRVAELVAERLG